MTARNSCPITRTPRIYVLGRWHGSKVLYLAFFTSQAGATEGKPCKIAARPLEIAIDSSRQRAAGQAAPTTAELEGESTANRNSCRSSLPRPRTPRFGQRGRTPVGRARYSPRQLGAPPLGDAERVVMNGVLSLSFSIRRRPIVVAYAFGPRTTSGSDARSRSARACEVSPALTICPVISSRRVQNASHTKGTRRLESAATTRAPGTARARRVRSAHPLDTLEACSRRGIQRRPPGLIGTRRSEVCPIERASRIRSPFASGLDESVTHLRSSRPLSHERLARRTSVLKRSVPRVRRFDGDGSDQ
jgi:hypothetical protein